MAFERDLEGASIYGLGSVLSWRDHSCSSEKVKQRAEQRWGTAARQRQYSAQRHMTNISCTCTGPQEFCWLSVYMCTAHHCSGYSCSNLSTLSVQENTTPLAPEGHSPSLLSADQFPKPRLACLLSSLPELPVTSELCLCPLCHP